MLNKTLQLELQKSVKEFIESHPDGCNEFKLMKYLEQHFSVFKDLADNSELCLFRKHFLIMNVLYELQILYFEDYKKVLHISSTKIYVTSQAVDSSESSALSELSNVKLKEYYLDWSNFTDMDKEAVQDLLDSFWIRYYALDKRFDALQLLGLNETASATEIKVKFKALAAKHHPDKGGDTETFIQIRAAYETLKA